MEPRSKIRLASIEMIPISLCCCYFVSGSFSVCLSFSNPPLAKLIRNLRIWGFCSVIECLLNKLKALVYLLKQKNRGEISDISPLILVGSYSQMTPCPHIRTLNMSTANTNTSFPIHLGTHSSLPWKNYSVMLSCYLCGGRGLTPELNVRWSQTH